MISLMCGLTKSLIPSKATEWLRVGPTGLETESLTQVTNLRTMKPTCTSYTWVYSLLAQLLSSSSGSNPYRTRSRR
jgi:hypothetical protein